MKLFTRLITTTLAILVAAYLLPGVSTGNNALTAVITAIVLALLNASIKPLLIFLTLPVTIVTLGVFILVINALMILLAAAVVPGFQVDGFWHAFLFSIILSLITWIFNSLARPVKKEGG